MHPWARRNGFYAAVERYGEDRETLYVTAVICLVGWNPIAADGLIFGYKDMGEQSGPVEAKLPRSILAVARAGSTLRPFCVTQMGEHPPGATELQVVLL
ncbi:MAG: hypothetical protein VW935_06140 [Novosphingobium sp.]